MHTQKEIKKLIASTEIAMDEQPYEEVHHKVYVDLLLQLDSRHKKERIIEFHRNWTVAKYHKACKDIAKVATALGLNVDLLIGMVLVFLNPDDYSTIVVEASYSNQNKIDWPEFWESMQYLVNGPWPIDFDNKQMLFSELGTIGKQIPSDLDDSDSGECSGCY